MNKSVLSMVLCLFLVSFSLTNEAQAQDAVDQNTVDQDLVTQDVMSAEEIEQERVRQAMIDPQRFQIVLRALHELLSHKDSTYVALTLDDQHAKEIGEAFLSRLDPQRIFFTVEDISFLLNQEGRSGEILSALRGDDLTWVRMAAERFQEKHQRRLEWASHRLLHASPVSENMPVRNSETTWASNRHLDHIWQDFMTNDLLNIVSSDRIGAIEALRERYLNQQTQVQELTDVEIFSLFAQSYAEYVDPHSTYLSPQNKTAFQAALMRTFEGVGIVWNETESGIVVSRTMPGGPAADSGQVLTGDRLLSFSVTPGVWTDVTGRETLSSLIEQMNGPVNGHLYLRLLSASGQEKEVDLIRRRIDVEGDIAELNMIERNEQHIAVISLPNFYRDMANPYRRGGSVSYDVRRLLREAQMAHPLSAVVLDLRNNGGGVMEEAAQVVGTFINEGPVVSVRAANGEQRVVDLVDGSVMWEGPLVVLINSQSASASEITAAALQDHGRALIVGQQTFGKGSAQTLVDIDRWARINGSVYGQVNITTMMFFRPSGESTQFEGVRPDIQVAYHPLLGSSGERSLIRPIEREVLPSYGFETQDVLSVEDLELIQQRSIERWERQEWFDSWSNYIELMNTTPSLNQRHRQQQQQQREILRNEIQALIQADEGRVSDDPVLNETIEILQDWIN